MGLERWGWFSLLVNVALIGLHGILALVSDSLAVSAEVVHYLLDFVGAAAVLAGIRLAGRKIRRFPYRLYKVESMVALGLAGLAGLSLRAAEINNHPILLVFQLSFSALAPSVSLPRLGHKTR